MSASTGVQFAVDGFGMMQVVKMFLLLLLVTPATCYSFELADAVSVHGTAMSWRMEVAAHAMKPRVRKRKADVSALIQRCQGARKREGGVHVQ